MADGVNVIHERMLGQIDDSYDKTKGEFIFDVTMPMAIELADLTKKADAILDRGFADTAKKADLDRKCAERGIIRKQAIAATGTVTVTGTAGAAIPKGELVASDTVSFAFVSNAVLPESGTLEIAVECKTPGTAGNIPAGAVKSFPKTLEGLRTVTNAAAFANGYDEESDASLRERYYIKVRTPATSGNKWHYLGWAKEVAGVGDARIFPLKYGAGTVGVTIINANKRGADSALIAAVAAHIEEERPIGASVTVESAAEIPVSVSVHLVMDEQNYNTGLVQQNIETAVTDYLAEIAFHEDYVSYARVGGIILNCDGVLDYSDLQLNGGTSNISIPQTSVAVPGGVTIE